MSIINSKERREIENVNLMFVVFSMQQIIERRDRHSAMHRLDRPSMELQVSFSNISCLNDIDIYPEFLLLTCKWKAHKKIHIKKRRVDKDKNMGPDQNPS